MDLSSPVKCSMATLLTLSMLAGCSIPKPGPNLAAERVQAPESVPLAHDPSVGTQVAALAQNEVVVEFSSGGAVITEAANRQLDLSARLFRDAHALVMFVDGHANATGTEYGNVVLSARRAQAAKEALVARGIPADRMVISAYGVSKPIDGQDPKASENCRVVITWRLL